MKTVTRLLIGVLASISCATAAIADSLVSGEIRTNEHATFVERLRLDGFERDAADALHAEHVRLCNAAVLTRSQLQRWALALDERTTAYPIRDVSWAELATRRDYRIVEWHHHDEVRRLRAEYFHALEALSDAPPWHLEGLRLEALLERCQRHPLVIKTGVAVPVVDLRRLRTADVERSPALAEVDAEYAAAVLTRSRALDRALWPGPGEAIVLQYEEEEREALRPVVHALTWALRETQKSYVLRMRDELRDGQALAFEQAATAALNPFAFADSGLSWSPDESRAIATARHELIRAYEAAFAPANLARLMPRQAEARATGKTVPRPANEFHAAVFAFRRANGVRRASSPASPRRSRSRVYWNWIHQDKVEGFIKRLDPDTRAAVAVEYASLRGALGAIGADSETREKAVVAFETAVGEMLPETEVASWAAVCRASRRIGALLYSTDLTAVPDLVDVLETLEIPAGEPPLCDVVLAYELDMDEGIEEWQRSLSAAGGIARTNMADRERLAERFEERMEVFQALHVRHRDTIRAHLPEKNVFRYDVLVRHREHHVRFPFTPAECAAAHLPEDLPDDVRSAWDETLERHLRRAMRLHEQTEALRVSVDGDELLDAREADRLSELLDQRSQRDLRAVRELRRLLGDDVLRTLPIVRFALTAFEDAPP